MTDAPLPFEAPLGVRPRSDRGFHARLWAPDAQTVRVVVDGRAPTDAGSVGFGVWEAHLPDLGHGDRYRVELDGHPWPDPWSRWQPEGTHGPSAAVDPTAIGALPPGTAGRPARPDLALDHAVISEIHTGTYTPDGTFAGVASGLERLADLGVTHVELMPVAQFPGERGWGYDGIQWSAAHGAYGGPAELVALVDRAHEVGLGVILDVVYNHVGPTGDTIYQAFGPFFTDRHHTPWGPAVNVDGPGSGAVRETIIQSAEWWVGEIGVDGIRVDACHAIVDQSARTIFAELADRVHRLHPGALVVAESGLNDPRVVRPEASGGWGFDADWADDFHHSLRTLLTDDRQGWYVDFGEVHQLAKAFHRPLVHDGTWSGYRGRRFGAPADDVAAEHFVVFAQNHDQVGNRPLGDRLPAAVRPLALLCTLFSPSTPMLFMGEEHGEDAPFQFFSDHQDPFIADATRDGRRREFADFTVATGEEVPDPQDRATFERSRLTWHEDPAMVALCTQAIALRAQLPAGDPEVDHDDEARWLRVRRGPWVLVANLSGEDQAVPTPSGPVLLATHPTIADACGDHLALPPWSGAVIRTTAS